MPQNIFTREIWNRPLLFCYYILKTNIFQDLNVLPIIYFRISNKCSYIIDQFQIEYRTWVFLFLPYTIYNFHFIDFKIVYKFTSMYLLALFFICITYFILTLLQHNAYKMFINHNQHLIFLKSIQVSYFGKTDSF